MKWSVYKRMSKEHKEEYNYKFNNTEWTMLQIVTGTGVLVIASIKNQSELATIFVVSLGFLSIWSWLGKEYLENKWIKQKGYTQTED